MERGARAVRAATLTRWHERCHYGAKSIESYSDAAVRHHRQCLIGVGVDDDAHMAVPAPIERPTDENARLRPNSATIGHQIVVAAR